VGALITAIALFVALTIMVHSFRETVATWVNQSISGDVFLRPKMAELNHYRDPLPQEVVSGLQNLQTQVDVLPYHRIFLRYEKHPYQFEAIDFATFVKYARFILIRGQMEEILQDLNNGRGVLVSEVFANQTGLGLGEHFHAEVKGVEFNLPILGIFRDYRTQGGVVHYSLPRFMERTGDPSWSGVRIYFTDPRSNDTADTDTAAILLKDEILQRCSGLQHAIEVTVGNDLRREIMRIFDETFAITTVLLLIALVVAALGITTTLTLLVLERSRQIHTLIAGGASPGQIRSMIFWEAVLMVLSGELIGLVCGFILSYLLVFVINRQSFGWTFMYSVDWVSLPASLPLILVTALLAAVPACQLVLRRSSALVLRE
jgi:putative ABC transport system permease protein